MRIFQQSTIGNLKSEMPMNALAIQLPANDIDEFSMIPSEERDSILEWVEVCREIADEKSVSAGLRKVCKRHALAEGTAKRKFYRWLQHGWRGLLNNSKGRRSRAAMDIGETFKVYCERNQRSSNEAYRTMMRDFRKGVSFPDLGTWRQVWTAEHPDIATPKNCPHDYTPHGWTYANLMKQCGLSKYEITAARIGPGAAREFLPSVLSTRLGLPVGAWYMFDDMWHDAKVNFGSNSKAQRIIELACVDVASACRFAYGLKPRMENLDSKTINNLTEADMRMLVAHVLINVGYHPGGCTLVVEHGTAAVSMEQELLIGRLSGGDGAIINGRIEWTAQPVVKISRGGMINAPLHKGLFAGQSRGNYKRKAALESQHSLAHTVAAMIAGQVGRNRDHSPEQMYGLEKYNNQLIRCAAALPPERAERLAYPLQHFHQYTPVISELYDIMNWRTWHDLEGWVECGYLANEFRLSPTSNEWMPMSAIFTLPAEDRERLSAALELPGLTRTRSMAPMEVWNAGQAELVRFPKSTMPMLLGERLGDIKEVGDDGLITYFNREYSASEFHFQARGVMQPNDFRTDLILGRKYLIHINPFNTKECFISDPVTKAFIGIAGIWGKVAKVDTEALEKMAGRQAAIAQTVIKPMARRGADVIRERIEMDEHNLRVVAGSGAVPQRSAKRQQQVAVPAMDVNDLINHYNNTEED
jgi:hypothetical protein